jgi:uncharacterized Fe-S cluster-containing protein
MLADDEVLLSREPDRSACAEILFDLNDAPHIEKVCCGRRWGCTQEPAHHQQATDKHLDAH